MLNGHDLRRDIMQQLGQPVWMANDADCFTLSEAVDAPAPELPPSSG
ncbi:ROK family Glucokinase with ambiguous substrate specificity [Klebsiella pneumoniae ISC21]|nr:ROK family Glucokinase with ambiguous substrate specificity [Klebsiella pneumoniae ISC21]